MSACLLKPSEKLKQKALLSSNSPFCYILFFAVMAALPSIFTMLQFDGGGRYQIGVLNDIGLYISLALSLNIILGSCGLFNMGHAAFFAIGAYTTAILDTQFGVPVLYSMPIAGLLAGLFAYVIALPIIHLRGDYLLLVTIGIVEILRIALVNNIFGLTNGADGIFGISRPAAFGIKLSSPQELYYLIWAFAALSTVVFYRINNSRFGRALNFIKYDDTAAAGIGINVVRYKLAAFAVGAFWAGMTGTLYATKMNAIAPESFNFFESVLIFAIVILGGAGNIAGVILGTFLIIGLPEVFRELQSARLLVFGAAMCAMMIFRPEGLLPAKRLIYNAGKYIGRFPTALRQSSALPNTPDNE